MDMTPQATSSYDTTCTTIELSATSTQTTCNDPLKTHTGYFIDLCTIVVLVSFGYWFLMKEKRKNYHA